MLMFNIIPSLKKKDALWNKHSKSKKSNLNTLCVLGSTKQLLLTKNTDHYSNYRLFTVAWLSSGVCMQILLFLEDMNIVLIICLDEIPFFQ